MAASKFSRPNPHSSVIPKIESSAASRTAAAEVILIGRVNFFCAPLPVTAASRLYQP